MPSVLPCSITGVYAAEVELECTEGLGSACNRTCAERSLNCQIQMLQFAKCPLQVFSPASGHLKEADALQLLSADHPVMHNAHVATSFRWYLKLCRRELQAEFGASWDVFTMAEALRSRAEGGRNRLRKASEVPLQVPVRPRSAQLRASRFLVVYDAQAITVFQSVLVVGGRQGITIGSAVHRCTPVKANYGDPDAGVHPCASSVFLTLPAGSYMRRVCCVKVSPPLESRAQLAVHCRVVSQKDNMAPTTHPNIMPARGFVIKPAGAAACKDLLCEGSKSSLHM